MKSVERGYELNIEILGVTKESVVIAKEFEELKGAEAAIVG